MKLLKKKGNIYTGDLSKSIAKRNLFNMIEIYAQVLENRWNIRVERINADGSYVFRLSTTSTKLQPDDDWILHTWNLVEQRFVILRVME